MKKILSILIAFVAVIAFSGLAMAEPVTAYSIKDIGDKTVTKGDMQTIHHWYLKYYSKDHVKFYFTTYVQIFDRTDESYYDNHGNYIGGGHWVNLYRITYIRDYKKVSYHRLKVIDTEFYNGKEVLGSFTDSGYVKTSKTAYQRFKLKKSTLINHFLNIKYRFPD